MTEGEIFEKYDNLCENELNSENNKEVYIRKVVMTSVIVSSKKKRKKEKRKKEKQMDLEENQGFHSMILCYRVNSQSSQKWEKCLFIKLILILIRIMKKKIYI